jgi:hypothetical protein
MGGRKRAHDLKFCRETAWEYAAAHPDEIDRAIRENEAGEEGLDYARQGSNLQPSVPKTDALSS